MKLSRMTPLKRVVPVITVAALAGMTWLVPALAATNNNTITACANLSSGALRETPPGPACVSTEQAVSWNIVGPTGPTGPTGATGATGPQGPTGPTGATG